MTAYDKIHTGNQSRLEWISLVYLLFFVLAVASPSFISHGYFGLKEEYAEETLIFIFGIAGLITFTLYNRIMESRLKERDTAIIDAERAKKELIDSYRYIGQVNRQIDMLKKLSNQTSMTLVDAAAYRKDLLQSIVSNAAAVTGSRRALLRFADIAKLRTDSETYFSIGNSKPLKISNHELRGVHENGMSHAFVDSEEGHSVLVVASDRKSSLVRAFLIFSVEETPISDVEVSLLKVFVNQAELVYFNLNEKPAGATTPLQMIDAVTAAEKGEVS